MFILTGKLKTDSKKVMFESFLGKQYSCNPRAIYEYMKKNHPEYKLIWSVDPRFEKIFKESNLEYSYRFSIKWLYHMATAKYWVTNSRMPLWIPKSVDTIYLQTWHGTPLKKLASDIEKVQMPGTDTKRYKENFYKESRNWDYLISPNRYSTEIFKRAFNFDKTVIESGYPRNDSLYNDNDPEKINLIKNKLGISDEKKVILYAPTWRDNLFYEKGKYKFETALNMNKMRDSLADEYVLLIRMHYLISDQINLEGLESFVYDVSNYEDIRDLYLISDLLVTDYSSVFFDFANLNRPILFFVHDLEEYKNELRGFYFDFEKEAPGPLTRTTKDLISEINHIGNYDLEKVKNFNMQFCSLEDGRASQRVVEKIFKK